MAAHAAYSLRLPSPVALPGDGLSVPRAMIDIRNSVYVGHLGPIPLYLHWSALFLCVLAWQWGMPSGFAIFSSKAWRAFSASSLSAPPTR